MSTDERYDEATVDKVADEIRTFLLQEAATDRPWDFAEHIVTTLADAGLLLPPGGEKTTAVGHWSPHRGYLYECGGHNEECTWPVGGTFMETRWPDGYRHTGPWTELPDDPA